MPLTGLPDGAAMRIKPADAGNSACMLGSFMQERGRVSYPLGDAITEEAQVAIWSEKAGVLIWVCVTRDKSHSFICSAHACPEMCAWVWVQSTLDGLMGSPLQPDLSQKMEVGGTVSLDYK